MTGFSRWWRKAGGVVLVLVFAVMALAPTSAAACTDDVSVAAASGAAQVQPGNTGPDPCDDGVCVCAQCGCHHASVHAPALMATSRTPLTRYERHVLVQPLAPTFDLSFGFKRPPRA